VRSELLVISIYEFNIGEYYFIKLIWTIDWMKNKIILTTKELSVLFDSEFGLPTWLVCTVNIFSPPQLWFSNNKRVVRKTEFLGVTKKFWPCPVFRPPPATRGGRPPPGCRLPPLWPGVSQPVSSANRLPRVVASGAPAPPSRPRPLRLRYRSPQDAGTDVWVVGTRVSGCGGPGFRGAVNALSSTRYLRLRVCLALHVAPLKVDLIE